MRAMYRKLSRAWGRQHWWPAETPFEVIVGAILTQNTSWTNVERALASLRAAGTLNVAGIRALSLPKLQRLIRSSGYFRQKARRLKNFVAFLDARYGGSLERMFATPTAQLRAELLALNGIGPETADSILLYAGNHPIFVVDAYTRRILERHEVVSSGAKYDEIRGLVERALQHEKPLPPAQGWPDETTKARDSSTFCDEHCRAQCAVPGIQRNAWTIRTGGKTLLPEEQAKVRIMPARFDVEKATSNLPLATSWQHRSYAIVPCRLRRNDANTP